MATNSQRLLRIYNRLRRGPVTIDIITAWAKTAGITISPRQLYRDLNNLQKLKINEGENVIEYNDENNLKTWKLEYDSSKEQMSQFDINSFILFKNFIPSSISSARKESFEKFETILYQFLSKNKFQNKSDVNELYLRKTDWYDNLYGTEEHIQLEEIIWALQNKRTINILSCAINPSNIDKSKYPFPLSFLPLELLFHRGRVHIAGMESKSLKVLIYTIDKSLQLELTNHQFNRKKLLPAFNKEIDNRFGITEPINDKVYEIRMNFDKGYALSMQNFYWHKTAKWTESKNGNLMLKMKCQINRELVGFIAQGLEMIEVKQPLILKKIILDKVQEVCQLYM